MNKHILLVMKWLNNQDSVSQKELAESRREAASAAADGVVYTAIYWAAESCTANAACWVDEYFEITGKDRNEYLKELNR